MDARPAVVVADEERVADGDALLAAASGGEVDAGTICDDEAADGEAPQRHSRLLPIGLAVLVLLFLVRAFVAEPVRTDGNSMEPTLHDGDVLVIDSLSYRLSGPAIGDIVVAEVPTTGERVVKRVVAVEGDTVGIEDGVLIRNGQPVEEPYADHTQMGGYYWGPVQVAAGQVFLLGDNRLESVDSRHYGPVPVGSLGGRLLVRVWGG